MTTHNIGKKKYQLNMEGLDSPYLMDTLRSLREKIRICKCSVVLINPN